jgi:hypothetical protein
MIGNLYDMPIEKPWSSYRDISLKYSESNAFDYPFIHQVDLPACVLESDIIHLSVFGSHFIILNSSRVANDLLEQKVIYASRWAIFTTELPI